MGSRLLMALVLTGVTAGCGEDDFTTFRVEIENVSIGALDTPRADGTVPLSPGVFAVFQAEDPIFLEGERATPGLELLAEEGIAARDLAPVPFPLSLLDEVESTDNVLASGVFGEPLGIQAGQTVAFAFQAERGEELQIATMLVQTNDWFLAFDGGGLLLFDGVGNPVQGNVTDQLVIYDAGTEVDEPPGLGENQPLVTAGLNVGAPEDEPIQPAAERHGATLDVPDVDDLVRVRITPILRGDD